MHFSKSGYFVQEMEPMDGDVAPQIVAPALSLVTICAEFCNILF